MASIEQRVGQLEGAYAHLATKADLAELEARLSKVINTQTRWFVGVQFAGYVAVAAIVSAVVAVLKLV